MGVEEEEDVKDSLVTVTAKVCVERAGTVVDVCGTLKVSIVVSPFVVGSLDGRTIVENESVSSEVDMGVNGDVGEIAESGAVSVLCAGDV